MKKSKFIDLAKSFMEKDCARMEKRLIEKFIRDHEFMLKILNCTDSKKKITKKRCKSS